MTSHEHAAAVATGDRDAVTSALQKRINSVSVTPRRCVGCIYELTRSIMAASEFSRAPAPTQSSAKRV